MNIHDKEIERKRYDNRSKSVINMFSNDYSPFLGSAGVDLIYRTPYLFYEELIKQRIKEGDSVLELGSGSGMHTEILLETGANVLATDISQFSLDVLMKTFSHKYGQRISTCIADIEKLPFEDNTFDFITCAGSLSYGNNQTVFKEIIRVLKIDGEIIFIDSLNDNPIYRMNRYLHFLRGERTRSTLVQMLSLKKIKLLQSQFVESQVFFFGSISWASKILSFLFGQEKTKKLIDKVDEIIKVNKSAFKFVLHAKSKI